MIEIKLDEEIFKRGSHVEIKKRNKDGGYIVLEVPKAKEVKAISNNQTT